MKLDLNLLWPMVILVIILNIILYLVEPLKYSGEKNCLKLPCRQFTIYNQLLGYTFDICIIMVIASMLGFKATPVIFIVSIFFGFLIYTSWRMGEVVVKDDKLNPPPKLFLVKDARIALQFIVLFLDITIFILLFLIKNNTDINVQSIMNSSNSFIKNKGFGITKLINTRFGGNIKGNRFIFFCGWFAFLGIFQNIYNVYKAVTFHPTYYNLPLSWKR